MSKLSGKSPERKLQVVLSVLRGEVSAADAARRPGMDFSEFETAAGGTWRLGGVVDYFSKLALACAVTATGTAADLTAALDAAAAQALLGHALSGDCVDERTGEPVPVIVVTDNGSPVRSTSVARWVAARAHFTHVRTRHRSPHTNGVVERWFESLKYERLYRHDIADGIDLADHVASFVDEYRRIQPRQAPREPRLAPAPRNTLEPRTFKPHQPETEQQT